MKAMRILAVILAMLMIFGVFVGCDKKDDAKDDKDKTEETAPEKEEKEEGLTVESVKKDTAKALEEGAALLFSNSFLSVFADPMDKTAYTLSLDSEEMSGKIVAATDLNNGKASVVASIESPNYVFDDAGNFSVDGTVSESYALYYDNKQVVIEAAMLEDIFGTSAIGVNADITFDEFKETAVFEAVLEMAEMTEQEFEEALASEELEQVKTLATAYAEKLQELANNAYLEGEIAEETITVGGKEVKTIVVPTSISESYYDDLVGETVKLLEELAKLGEDAAEITEEDVEDLVEQLSAAMPDVEATTKSYLSVETGALVKYTTEGTSTVALDGVETTATTKLDVDFGADPTKELLPSVTYEVTSEDASIKFVGVSKTEDDKYVFEGTAKVEDGEGNTMTEFGVSLESDKDGKFVFAITYEQDNVEVTVKFDGTLKYEDGKLELDVDLAPLAETEEAIKVGLAVESGEGVDIPKLPEYTDILSMTAEEFESLASLLVIDPGFGYEDDFYYEDDYYYDDDYYYEDDYYEDDYYDDEYDFDFDFDEEFAY